MPERAVPVYTTQEVDRLLKEDPEFTDRIGGYSTFSLTFVRQGFSEGGFHIPAYGLSGAQHVSIDLHPDVHKRVFGDESRVPEAIHFPESLLYNRKHGEAWVAFELYREVVNKKASYAEIDDLYLDVPFSEYRELYQKIGLVNLNDLIRESPWLSQNPEGRAMDVRTYFKFDRSFIRLLKGMELRKGVQVFYGDKESLASFISDPRSDVEDIDDCGVAISRSVPGELVLGLVPLGPYEQEALVA